jgi:HAD superfamily hydrolase (TIGR01458 family)
MGGRRSFFVSERRFFASNRRSREAAVGFVATRRRSTFSASRSCATSRSVASSRLRHWLRSSCATARSVAPAFATARRFCASLSAEDPWTRKVASTRVSDVFACWPPGPLEREKRSSISLTGRTTDRVTRIDSPSMAAILLDVDGVLHVSGEPIPGAVEAVARLRSEGHRLRFVTNNSTRSRAELAADLRAMGLELEDDELQTTPTAAARELGGRRVYALVLPAIVPDLAGVELVGDGADAVLVGGCDEGLEPNQVFSYMNLARAFSELQAGADLFALHKNPWWQTARGPMLDGGAFVAALEYATGLDATVIGKPSASCFAAALAALDAEPELTWMITDDLDQDVRGAQLFGMRTILLRTGKFRPEALERSTTVPDAVLSSLAHVPDWIERSI